MTVPNYKPIYRSYWAHMAAGAAFWTLAGVVAWSFYKFFGGE